MTRTAEQFIQEMEGINQDIEILGQYTRAADQVQVRCRVCGREWAPKAYSLLGGKGCPSCSAKRGAMNNKGKTGLKTRDQFMAQLKTVDDSILIESEYLNGHTNVKCHCLRCGNEWFAKPYSLLQGHGCPRCARSGTSFMEQFILLSFQEALGEINVLSRDKKSIGKELDIYLPSQKIAIEPGNWWLHKRNIQRDEEKRRLCAEKGIRLITIYDKYPKSQPKPFSDNIYVFSEDLNVADHSIICNLVKELFKEAGIETQNFDFCWDRIEATAYDRAKSVTHEQFLEKMRIIHPNIKVIGHYRNANKRIQVKCGVCGYEWNAVPGNLLSGDGCRRCGTKKAHADMFKKQESFIEEIKRVNPNVEIVGKYIGRHSPVKARCKICGFEWEPRASSLLRGSNHKGAKSMHHGLLL